MLETELDKRATSFVCLLAALLLAGCGGGLTAAIDEGSTALELEAATALNVEHSVETVDDTEAAVEVIDAAETPNFRILAVTDAARTFTLAGTAFNATPCASSVPTASLGTTCSFKGTYRVAYGASGRFVTRVFTNGVTCSNDNFGDPIRGVVKQCFVAIDIATSPPPPPASPPAPPAPAPAPAPAPPALGQGSLTLNWNAPTANADGTPINDLAGFRVFYGTASGSYANSVAISDARATSHTIRGLPAGAYYVVVRAYDASNNESAASVEAGKVIR